MNEFRKAFQSMRGRFLDRAGQGARDENTYWAPIVVTKKEIDAAIERLRIAVDRGLKTWPDLAISLSGMYELRDDPRLRELDELMVENINEQRAILDLEPIKARNGAWR